MKENTIESTSKVENIKELLNAIKSFSDEQENNTIANFLDQSVLVNENESNESKETVMMSFVNSIKKARADRTAEQTPSTSDLPRPDVPRDIEEPTLMDVLKNAENEEDDSI